MLRGQFLDPRGSKIGFGEFAERWASSLTVDAKTAEGIASRLRAHLLPAFGDLELRHVKPSTVQGWLGGLARTHEPSYVRLLLGTLSTILGAAVEDGLIPSNLPGPVGEGARAAGRASRRMGSRHRGRGV
jgi:hypothetical protein